MGKYRIVLDFQCIFLSCNLRLCSLNMVNGIRGEVTSYQSAIDHIATLLYLWLIAPEVWVNQPRDLSGWSILLYLMMIDN